MGNLTKLFALILFMGIILFPIYAFASSNSGAELSGEEAAPIGGWAVSNFSYQFSDDPSRVESITFDLNAPANQVSAKLSSTSAVFSSCVDLGGYHWECDFTGGIKVANMDEIRITAIGY